MESIRYDLVALKEEMVEGLAERPELFELSAWSRDGQPGFNVVLLVDDGVDPTLTIPIEELVDYWISDIFDPDCAEDYTRDEPSIANARERAAFLRSFADRATKIEDRIRELQAAK
jgi:hypothetical protein